MHGKVVLAGPVFVFAMLAMGLTAGLAAYVAIDSLRRGPGAFSRLPEPQWLYAVPQLAYAALFGLAFVPAVTKVVGLPLVLATPFAFAEQVAYLLRVVFHRPMATSDDVEADGEAVAPPAPETRSEDVAEPRDPEVDSF